jgi:hypothetical protein
MTRFSTLPLALASAGCVLAAAPHALAANGHFSDRAVFSTVLAGARVLDEPRTQAPFTTNVRTEMVQAWLHNRP